MGAPPYKPSSQPYVSNRKGRYRLHGDAPNLEKQEGGNGGCEIRLQLSTLTNCFVQKESRKTLVVVAGTARLEQAGQRAVFEYPVAKKVGGVRALHSSYFSERGGLRGERGTFLPTGWKGGHRSVGGDDDSWGMKCSLGGEEGERGEGNLSFFSATYWGGSSGL